MFKWVEDFAKEKRLKKRYQKKTNSQRNQSNRSSATKRI